MVHEDHELLQGCCQPLLEGPVEEGHVRQVQRPGLAHVVLHALRVHKTGRQGPHRHPDALHVELLVEPVESHLGNPIGRGRPLRREGHGRAQMQDAPSALQARQQGLGEGQGRHDVDTQGLLEVRHIELRNRRRVSDRSVVHQQPQGLLGDCIEQGCAPMLGTDITLHNCDSTRAWCRTTRFLQNVQTPPTSHNAMCYGEMVDQSTANPCATPGNHNQIAQARHCHN
mmetsp:Transcript_143767/g.400721  ORF Transcript_143767/g.400721 Transcript_143767/m.400721 type:complete len:227 (+) Transcript_143767:288-968(+)